MNKAHQRTLLASIRERAQMFHRETGLPKGFRAEATDGGATAVYLYDYIGGWDGITAKDVVSTLAGISGDVELHINSGGGDIFEGTAIFNALKNHKGKITSYVDGIAASAASFVALAGSEVVIEDNGTMMVHDGWGFTIGNEEDHLEAAGVLGKLSNTIAKMYADKTGDTQDYWRGVMRAETWYDADEAVAAKLADRKAGGQTAANAFDLSIFNYAGRAAAPAPANTKQTQTISVEGLRNALIGV